MNKHRTWRTAPVACLVAHSLAMLLGAFMLPGTPLWQSDPAVRLEFVADSALRWRAGWWLWMASSLTLVALYNSWRRSLPPSLQTRLAVVIACAGAGCDWYGEFLYLRLPKMASVEPFAQLERLATLWTAGAANGLYTIAGICLTLRTLALPAVIRSLQWATWACGVAMTLSAIADSTSGLLISSLLLFPLLLSWVFWMARRSW